MQYTLKRLLFTIIAIKLRLYTYLKCKKVVKYTGSLTKYINACKILIFLSCWQFLNLKPVLNYNITNFLNLLSNNNKKDIKLIILENNKEKIRLADIDNNKKNIRPTDINKKKPITINWTFWNRLLSKFFLTFRKVIFNKSEFLAGISVLNTKYKHLKCQIYNLIYLFND